MIGVVDEEQMNPLIPPEWEVLLAFVGVGVTVAVVITLVVLFALRKPSTGKRKPSDDVETSV